ncbi:STE/STE11 protein kinase [Thecamonas trahens ATCC 50062]|uniref:STE/STE11 protein kinase n=1 Tax=Thecamonas trahens ATCC 50062 TaxID=461836 RepID=A0A0L0DJ37_THETB|nr:STE/STE11 protein kinase [Thecamonas trahens ATCC 50062]KNC52086.1 STE/STE11 protein kinase [Thecamonas trahens ATCC 50062]|eukprot:XP_013762091.1 STE/STE11 protein kinase [Thecamonas trahens ATCC 50062]
MEASGQGRVDCVRLPVPPSNTTVSGVHFKIWYEDRVRSFFVADCGSTNGTWYAEPALAEELKDYRFLGDRYEDAGAQCVMALKPLSSFKAADTVFVVEDVILPAGLGLGATEALDLDATASSTGGRAATLPESRPVDTVIQMLRGPLAGAHYVREFPQTYALGRAPGKPSLHAPGAVPVLVETDDPHLSRHHLNLRFVTPPDAAEPGTYMVDVLSTTYYCRKLALGRIDAQLDALPWRRLEPGSSKLLRHDDLVRAGSVIFLVTSHAEVPRKMDPPYLVASSPSSLFLKWDPPLSPTTLRGFVLAISDGQPGTAAEKWRKLYGGPLREFVAQGLKPSSYYWFRIHARNSGGDGPWSKVIRFLTVASDDDGSAGNLTPTVSLSMASVASPLGQRRIAFGPTTAAAGPHDPEPESDDDATASVTMTGPIGGGGGGESSAALDSSTFTLSTIKATMEPALLSSGSLPASDSGRDAVTLIREALASSDDLSWRVRSVLGVGGQARVYLAHMEAPVSMPVAVKEYQLAEGDTSGLADVTHRINAILATLDHPNIVRFYGSATRAQADAAVTVVHVFLEYVAGGSLSRMLADLKSGLSEPDAAHYLGQMVAGVAYLHRHSVIHGDLKPDNVLLKVDGHRTVVKLADFGGASLLSGADHTSAFVGTPHFMAPEAIRTETATPESDVWSLGCTLLEMLTGRMPWSHLNKQAAIFSIGTTLSGPSRPESLSHPASLFLDACFALDPAARASATDLLDHPFVLGGGDAAECGDATNASARRVSSTAAAPVADVARSSGSPPHAGSRRSSSRSPMRASHGRGSPSGGASDVVAFEELNVLAAHGESEFVCECQDGTEVVVRFLGQSASAETLARVEAMASMRHPNCILFRGSCTRLVAGTVATGYMVEYMSSTLASLVAEPDFGSSCPLLAKLLLVKNIASGLYYLHAQNVTHGALVPWNVLYDPRSRSCKVGELGRVSPFYLGSQPDAVCGSLHLYLAPEVALFDALTPSADVFSLGAILMLVVFGLAPYTGLDASEPGGAHTSSPPHTALLTLASDAGIATAWSDIQRACCELVADCLALKASARPPIEEVVRKLKALVAQGYAS